jgi:hypothetical protein
MRAYVTSGLRLVIPDTRFGYNRSCGGYFYKGNDYALAEKLTEESNNKRLKALLKAWKTNARKAAGEKFVTDRKKRLKAKRQRVRLKMTVAREQREIQEIARKGADAVMKRMFEIATESMNETAAIAAGNVLLERAYGKANQTNINATIDANGKATDVSQKELDTRVAKVVERIEALTGGAAKAATSKDGSADVRKLDRDPDSPTQH